MDIYQITPTRIALRSRLHSLADLPPGVVAEGVWNQIAYEGQWQGHAAGEFKFDEEIFETIIANFARREDDIPATYGHPDGESGAAEGAAGWISELKIDTDEKGRTALFAKFKFNDRAAQKIKADELRYCSVVVGFESIDEVTGEPIGAELFEVGLVLSAFLDGMQRLAASKVNRAARANRGTHNMSLKEMIAAALEELPEDATLDQLLKWIDGEQQKQDALGGEPSLAPAEEADAADEPGDAVAASDESTYCDAVKAEDMPEEPPAEDPPGAEVALPAALAEVFAAALGVAPEELAALNPDEVAAAIGALQSMPEQEDAAAAGAAMARAMAEAVEVKLEKERTKTAELTATVSKQSAELAELRVDLMIAKGEIVEGKHTREELIEFSKSSPAMFAKFAAGGEKVPTGSVYKSGKTERRHNEPDSVRQALEECERKVRAEHPKLSNTKVKAKTYALAKATYPALFSGKAKT